MNTRGQLVIRYLLSIWYYLVSSKIYSWFQWKIRHVYLFLGRCLTNPSAPQKSTYSNQNSSSSCPQNIFFCFHLQGCKYLRFFFCLNTIYWISRGAFLMDLYSQHFHSVNLFPRSTGLFLYAGFLDLAIPMSVLQYLNESCFTSSVCFYIEFATLKHF